MRRLEELKSSNTILEVDINFLKLSFTAWLTCTHKHIHMPLAGQGETLDHALAQLGPGGGDGDSGGSGGGRQSRQRQSEEAIAREVEGMREEVTSLKTQLHTLNSIRKKMRYKYMRDKVNKAYRIARNIGGNSIWRLSPK